MPTVLKSKWDGLSDHLIARFFPVQRVAQGSGSDRSSRWEQIADQPEVHAPITDGTADHTANWNSPFENMGVDNKFSTVSAVLQSGSAESVANLWDSLVGLVTGSDAEKSNWAKNKVQELEGKTGITKLNSTQIYNGSPPSKISVTVHFRAFSDPLGEVEDPVNQLIKWALPRKLAYQGPVGAAAGAQSIGEAVDNFSLYPSKTPQIIAMKYAGFLFSPLVIESAPYALTGQRDSKGHLLSAQIQLTMGALTAIDANDWDEITGGWRIKV